MPAPPRPRPIGLVAAASIAVAVAALLVVPSVVPAMPGCAEGMSLIDGAFCIDRYEASLEEVLADQTTRPFSPYHAPERVVVRAVSRRGVVPQGYVSATQASRACRAAGKRLCSDAEWIRACRGPDRTLFPYGRERIAGRCNENHARHPVVQLFGHGHASIWNGAHMNDSQLNQLPGTLALTGAFDGCSNAFGVFDMVGNLHEWTSDPHGTFRGGFYMDTHMNGDGCAYATVAHDVGYHDYSTGFRCCATAGP